MRRRLRLWMAGLAIGMAGCASLAPPPDFRPVYGEDERIGVWLQRFTEEGETRQSLRALVSLKLDSPSGSGRVKEVILAERPARLRLETLNMLDQTHTLLVTDGEVFMFVDGKRREEGLVLPGLLRRTLGVDLEPEEAVLALLVAPNLPLRSPDQILGHGGERIVDLGSERLHFGSDGQLLGLEVLNPEGSVRWRAEYGGWRPVPGGRYPFSMVLYFPATELRAELRLKDVQLNPDLSPSLFTAPLAARE